MWTDALGMKILPALSADVVLATLAEIVVKGEDEISHKEWIANVVERGDAEHHIVDGADADEPETVEDALGGGQMAADVVEGGSGEQHHGPDGEEEEAQMQGHGKGVERGMIIIMSPRVGVGHLYGAIEHGGSGHGEREQRGIERRYVVEVHDLGVSAEQAPDDIECSHKRDEGHDDEEVLVGKLVDELRDGVVGRDRGQHLALAHPANGLLVACYLHPYGVDGVGGHSGNVGNNDHIATMYEERINKHAADHLGGLLADQQQRVGAHKEVVVVGIVMGGVERNGVHLLFSYRPCIAGRHILPIA